MSDASDYLLTIDNDKAGATKIAEETAAKLENNNVTLIEVVQSLGEYINDESAIIRSKAVRYLSEVIGALPPTFLTRQKIQVLDQFLCDRIEDGGAVGGLAKLSALGRFTKDMAVITFRALIEHFQDLQLRPQSQRLPIYELLNSLMLYHRPALRDLGDEALVAITDLVSGEKDPRNLMLIFSILKVVMVEWSVRTHAETLFDAVFCYFPITFRPPPDDPYGITAQDLKTRLRECIAASRCFAPFAFPQLIDKLDSTSASVKKDVLQTIAACAATYGPHTISVYSITLWDSLKFEVLNVQEEDLGDEALVALREIAVCLSETHIPGTEKQTPLTQYLSPITKECNEQLQSPQHKQAKPAGQILSSLGTASPAAYYLIGRTVLPPLLTIYQDADSIATQRALLEVITQIAQSATVVFAPPAIVAPLGNPLEPFKDRLIELTSQALMSTAKEEVSFRITALKCLVLMCSIPQFMEENEVGMVVQFLDEIILDEDHDHRDDIKDQAIQGLVEISRKRPMLIMNISFPAFIAKLPDHASEQDDDYLVVLESLARLSAEKAISDTLIRRLLSRLDIVLQNGGPILYPQSILSTLHYVLSLRDLEHDPNLLTYHEKIVVDLSMKAALGEIGKVTRTALNELAMLETLGRLCNLVIRALDSHKQTSTASQIHTLFLDANTFPPMVQEESTEPGKKSLVILSTYLMAGLRRDIPVPYTETSESIKTLLNRLVSLATEETSSQTRQSILRQIALIINKSLTVQQLHHATDLLWAPASGLLNESILSDKTLPVVFWVAKALVLRSASTEQVLIQLLGLLSHPVYGTMAAHGFGLLLAPDEILSKENFATIRLLTKQKVFRVCVPHIAKAFRTADAPTKSNYLIALSGILRHVATDILIAEMETLLPLLLQSIDLDNQDVKAATIQTLIVICQESPLAVESHVASLINRLLKVAIDTKANTPKVRSHALSCIRVLPSKMKQSGLLPLRSAVTRGMMNVLDDPRRNVRKEAVDCRAAWLALDEPDDGD